MATMLTVVCCVGIVGQPVRPVTAKAQTIAELEAQKAENNKKIQEYEAQLAQFAADQKAEEAYQTALTEKITVLQSNMQILDEELETIKSNIYTLNQDIATMELTIQRQEEDIDQGLKEFKLRLRAMYVNGNDSLASALVGATDFFDLLSKYELISCVARHDDELVNGLRDELDAYHSNLNVLEAQKEQEQQAKADSEAKQEEMKGAMAELQSAYAESEAEKRRLEAEQANAARTIADLEEKNRLADEAEEEIREQIRRAEEEAKRRAEEEARRRKEEAEAQQKAREEANRQEQQQSTPQGGNATVTPTPEPQPSYNDSSFGWPCPDSYYVSSGFGSRWGTTHKGIDIAQNQGSSVVASRSGTVIRAVSSCTHNYGKSANCCGNGYGNHVIIMHDDGTYSTLYGHMASINVSVGNYVDKGTTIGYVGSTGWSTGYHLHFEVRKNGTPVDPSGYLNY